MTATPNALQRTAPAVTLAAPPPSLAQPSRQPPPSLSLGSRRLAASHMKSLILTLIVLTPLALIAGPPFSYDSAVTWADDSTKTDVSKAQRIYVFGPQKTTETYSLNNKPAKHDVSIRRILRYRDSMTLGPLLRSLHDDVSSDFVVFVYRHPTPNRPVLRLTYAQALESRFSIQPLDVIDITIPAHGFVL